MIIIIICRSSLSSPHSEPDNWDFFLPTATTMVSIILMIDIGAVEWRWAIECDCWYDTDDDLFVETDNGDIDDEYIFIWF